MLVAYQLAGLSALEAQYAGTDGERATERDFAELTHSVRCSGAAERCGFVGPHRISIPSLVRWACCTFKIPSANQTFTE
jgi:hypothetical protein